jgi:hypothetical protein
MGALTEEATHDSGQRAIVALPSALIIRACCQRDLYAQDRALVRGIAHRGNTDYGWRIRVGVRYTPPIAG